MSVSETFLISHNHFSTQNDRFLFLKYVKTI